MPATCPKCGGEARLEAIREAGGRCPHCKARIKVKFTGVPRPVRRAPGKSPVQNLRSSLESIGPYEVIEEISRGGMGIVYKARDKSLKKAIAIKVLLRGGEASEEERRRFRREAEAAAKLQHSNIVPIHAVGVCEGLHYFVMDFIEGQQLDGLIGRGAVSPRQALDYVEQLADALAYAHASGVIHRDIKPANVIIDRYGRPQLMDFGLAKEVGSQTQLTQVGTTMGTPTYMPPEQAEGDLEGIDAQSDVYSLGTVLYEMLTGAPPFEGPNTMAILMQVLEVEPVRPRSVNPRIHPDIETICLTAMSKEKSDRYRSAEELREDIRRFKAGEAIMAVQPGAGRLLARWVRRHKEMVAALLLAVLALGGWGGWSGWRRRENRLSHLRAQRARIAEILDAAAAYLEKDQLDDAAALYRQVQSMEHAEGEEKAARGGLARIADIRKRRRIRFFLDRAGRYLGRENYDAAADMFTIVLEDYDPANAEAKRGLRAARGTGTLEVTSRPAGATVYLGVGEEFPEPGHGKNVGLGRRLGVTPLERLDVSMGLCRVTLVKKGYGRQSLPVEVGRNQDARLENVQLIKASPVGGDEAAVANLVEVRGGKVVLDDGREVQVETFYVDRYEFPNRLGAAPVCGKTRKEAGKDWGWHEAQDLAEEAGKKLPTHAQWVLAAAGRKGRRFPYGEEYDPGSAAVGLALRDGPLRSGGKPRDRSSFGVYDMSGNVSEWVRPDERRSVEPPGQEYPPYDEEDIEYLACGGNWTSLVPDQSSVRYAKYYTPMDEAPTVGFRCVVERSRKAPPRKPPRSPARPGTGDDFKEVWVEKCPPGMILIRPQPGTAAHKLVDYPFCIDKYEYPNKPNAPPRTGVTWAEADRLARAAGRRLIRFKEWRVACGGPDLQNYPFGNDYQAGKACLEFGALEKTRPDPCGKWAGSVSPWGAAHDLSGNVWEWVADWHNFNRETGKRGIVGGCWFSDRSQAKSTHWEGRLPTDKAPAIGFRCAVRLGEKGAGGD